MTEGDMRAEEKKTEMTRAVSGSGERLYLARGKIDGYDDLL